MQNGKEMQGIFLDRRGGRPGGGNEKGAGEEIQAFSVLPELHILKRMARTLARK